MKRPSSIVLIGLISAQGLACGGDDTPDLDPRVTRILALNGSAPMGEALFLGNCASSGCHGADGDVGMAADLSLRVPGGLNTELMTSMVFGIGNMPGFNALADQELANIFAYLQQVQDPRNSTILGGTGDATAGETLFNAQCTNMACHGMDGDSGDAVDLSVRVPSKLDRIIVNSLVNGRGNMPAFGTRTDDEIANLLAYLRNTFP